MLSRRRVEALAVGLLFYLPATLSIVLILSAPLYLTFWPLSLVYLTWMYIDRDTPFTSGRSSGWVRKHWLWQPYRDYFPQKLVKTADLDPSGNYILALFPHGIVSTSAFGHFFSQSSDFFKLFPGIRVTPVTLTLNFFLPLLRELFLAAGACSCAKRSILFRLKSGSGGEAVLLVPGGSAEALATVRGEYHIVLQSRRGFVHLAHQAGASIVPVFAFGETETYNHLNFGRGSILFKLQKLIKRVTGVAPCIAWGRSVFFRSFGFLPVRREVVTVVGKPIKLEKIEEPTDEVVNASHQLFTKELINLFETHKHKYLKNPESAHLIFDDSN